ncbi:tetratricopeptide repeat protein [Trichocoleus desertorum AS-A10]|uniref:tetratricopeptide repeat protein n=1 Tax=Trichocoleus desertorum TaxID=1481672 RepID=UPI00329796FF
MKLINYDASAAWQNRLRAVLSSPRLVALPVVGLLILIPIGLGLWQQQSRAQLDPLYRYQFSRPDPGKVTQALEREMAFYQTRILSDPKGGLNRAALARTYLKMARATGESSWYLLAEQTAQQSLANLSFSNPEAVLVLARVATARHDFAEALRLLKQAPGSPDALSTATTAHLALGDIAAADVAAEQLVKQTPSLGALTQRALVKVAQGQDRAAIQDLQQAIAVEEPEETGSSVWARTLLGRLYFKRGQLLQAQALYRETLRILPQYPPALLNLAELEVRQGNYRAAERYYSQFALTSQKSPTVHDHVVMRGMARVKELLGDTAAAQSWRDRAEARLREDLTGFGHRRELAHLLLERGRPKDIAEALTLMQQEVQARRDAETLDTFAWALSSAGRWPEAQQAMQAALQPGIRDAALFHRAGVIEQTLGNSAKAQHFFQLAQEADPAFDQQAQRALGLGVGLLGLS